MGHEKAIAFLKNRIKDRLEEVRDQMGKYRYKLYIAMVEECNDFDELKEMAELDLQMDLFSYVKTEIAPRLEELNLSLAEIRRADELPKELPKQPNSNEVYELAPGDITDQLEDEDTNAAMAMMLMSRIASEPVEERYREKLLDYAFEGDPEPVTESDIEDISDEDMDELGLDDTDDEEADTDDEFDLSDMDDEDTTFDEDDSDEDSDELEEKPDESEDEYIDLDEANEFELFDSDSSDTSADDDGFDLSDEDDLEGMLDDDEDISDEDDDIFTGEFDLSDEDDTEDLGDEDISDEDDDDVFVDVDEDELSSYEDEDESEEDLDPFRDIEEDELSEFEDNDEDADKEKIDLNKSEFDIEDDEEGLGSLLEEDEEEDEEASGDGFDIDEEDDELTNLLDDDDEDDTFTDEVDSTDPKHTVYSDLDNLDEELLGSLGDDDEEDEEEDDPFAGLDEGELGFEDDSDEYFADSEEEKEPKKAEPKTSNTPDIPKHKTPEKQLRSSGISASTIFLDGSKGGEKAQHMFNLFNNLSKKSKKAAIKVKARATEVIKSSYFDIGGEDDFEVDF